MIVTTRSPQETELLGEQIGKLLHGGKTLALFGGMGAGKTAFTRGIACGLGVTEGVSSPTFSLVHEYAGRVPVFHFDMFRVNGWDDLYSTGFFDYLESGGVLIIEWSENIESALPPDAAHILIEPGRDESERIFHIAGLDGFPLSPDTFQIKEDADS